MNAQHGFQRIRFSAAAGLGVERLDKAQQTCPGHDLTISARKRSLRVCLRLPAYSKSEKLIWLMGGSDQVVRRISLHLGTCSERP